MKLVVLVMVLMVGVFCSAALGDDWDSFEDGNDSDVSVEVVEDDADVVVVDSDEEVLMDSEDVKYTDDFYLALGVAAAAVFIVLLFAYLFFRKPREKWKKK